MNVTLGERITLAPLPRIYLKYLTSVSLPSANGANRICFSDARALATWHEQHIVNVSISKRDERVENQKKEWGQRQGWRLVGGMEVMGRMLNTSVLRGCGFRVSRAPQNDIRNDFGH